MRERDFASALVADFGRLIGILTARDLLRAFAGRVHSSEARVRDWMTVEPLAVTADATLDEAALLMTEHRIHHLPVVDGERPVGVVGLRDVTRSARVDRHADPRRPRLLGPLPALVRRAGSGRRTRTRASTDDARRAARAPGSGRARRPRAGPRRGARGGGRGRRARRRRRAARRGSRATSRPALPPSTSSSASTSVSGAIRNAASPISSARTPPGPKATSGPKTGSCTTPASSSAPPLTIGCTMTGAADPLRRRAHGVLVREVERDAARLRLVRARRGGLDDDGEAELAARPPTASSAVAATRSGTSGSP